MAEWFPFETDMDNAVKRRVVIGALGTAGAVILAVSASLLASAPASAQTVPHSVLVVGDSVVAQASDAISRWALPGSTVWPMGAMGTAPCDWVDSWRNPADQLHLSFEQAVDEHHPAAVVLAFSGNPGLSGPAAGCVDANTHYSLAALLASYRWALTDMASYASSQGARVYFSAAPPRNPATPAGAYTAAGGRPGYGFNGVPALNTLYQEIVSSPEGTQNDWTYDDAAAVAVSDAQLTWQLRLTCMPWDVFACRGGSVQVRAGGLDSIHLDPYGNGAARYGMAITRLPLENQLG